MRKTAIFGNQCNNVIIYIYIYFKGGGQKCRCSPLRVGTWDAIWSTINSQLLLYIQQIIWNSTLGCIWSSIPPLGLGLGRQVFGIRNGFLQRLCRHTTPTNKIKHVWLRLNIQRNRWSSWPSEMIQYFVNHLCGQFRFRWVLCIWENSWWVNIILKAKTIPYNLGMIHKTLCRPTMISLLQAKVRNH